MFLHFVGGVVVFLWCLCGGVFCVGCGCVFVVVLLWREALEKRVVDKCWRRALEECAVEECCREVLEKSAGNTGVKRCLV